MPGFIINQDRALSSVGDGVKPVNKIVTYESLDKNYGPTSMYDSSAARHNAIRKRLNTKAKRAQVYGVNNHVKQISGVRNDSQNHTFFVGLFPRMRLNHSTA
jgi:hypothetical protein